MRRGSALKRFARDSGGFTFLFALLAVVIMGIMQGLAGASWRQVMQREREEELLFRGLQIQEAITRWHQPQPGVQRQVAMPLNDLKDLLEDPRTPGRVRHLRRLYRDPMTNREFSVIREPNRGIVGVVSTSSSETIKKDNFPEPLQDLAGQQYYNQWKFVYKPQQKQPQGQQQTPAAVTAPAPVQK